MKTIKKWQINQNQAIILFILAAVFIDVLITQIAMAVNPQLSVPADASRINKYYLAVMVLVFPVFYLKSDISVNFDALKVKDGKQFGKSMLRALFYSLLVILAMFLYRLYLNSTDPAIAAWPYFGLYLKMNGRWFYPISSILQEFLVKGVSQHNFVKAFEDRNKFVGILANAVFFGILHMNYKLYYMLGAFLMCFLTAFLYEDDKHIYGCALIHFVVGFMPRVLGLFR